MSTTKKLQLPPFGTSLDEVEQIREDAIERQTESRGRARRGKGREIYPSDTDRWQRMLTITFPDRALLESLKEAAARLSQEKGVQISPTKLATLIMLAGLDLLKRGKLELVTRSAEIEEMAIKVIGDEA